MRVNGLNKADDFSRPVEAPSYKGAVGIFMNWIDERPNKLAAVGHRVVQGGPNYCTPQTITSEMIEELRRLG